MVQGAEGSCKSNSSVGVVGFVGCRRPDVNCVLLLRMHENHIPHLHQISVFSFVIWEVTSNGHLRLRGQLGKKIRNDADR